jgi:hypothetical protein
MKNFIKRAWDWAHTTTGDYVIGFVLFNAAIITIYVLFWLLGA